MVDYLIVDEVVLAAREGAEWRFARLKGRANPDCDGTHSGIRSGDGVRVRTASTEIDYLSTTVLPYVQRLENSLSSSEPHK